MKQRKVNALPQGMLTTLTVATTLLAVMITVLFLLACTL